MTNAKKKAEPGDQTAAERRAGEAQVKALITALAPSHSRLVQGARRALQKRLPTAFELVYEYRDAFVISYSPNENGYDGVLALRADADGVGLWFNDGKNLPDPDKLLRGSGKVTRSIALESTAMLARPAVARLMDEAIKRNPAPFAKSGRGALLIRLTAAAKRR
jgi:hypothetical protein